MTITDIDKQDWKYELIRDFTSPAHAHVHSFRQMNLNHEEIGKLIKFIENIIDQAKAEQREEILVKIGELKKPTEKSDDGGYEDFKTSTGSRDTLLQFAYNQACDDIAKEIRSK